MNAASPPAILLGDHTAALHVVRSLGRRGIRTVVVHRDRCCIARFSRYCGGFIRSPDFLAQEADFLSFLLSLGDQADLAGGVLIPTNDHTLRIVSRHRPRLVQRFRVPVPGWDTLSKVYDKRCTLTIAEEAGIPIPRTAYPETRDLAATCVESLDLPVVVKPAMGKRYYAASGRKMLMAASRREALACFDAVARVVGESSVIVQEYIPGTNEQLFNYACCMSGGRANGVFTGRKVRQVPRDFGTGSAAVACQDPELERLGTALLQACGYEGLAYVEFKKDRRDGRYKLMEINARVWNFVDLAMHGGADLPYVLYLFALQRPLPECRAEGSTFWAHLWLDLGGSLAAALRGTGSFRDLLDPFMRRDRVFAVLQKEDLMPFIAETLLLPLLYAKR